MVLKTQKPYLLNDIQESENDLSQKSMRLAMKMGVRSLICVPLIYEKESIGILAVDNILSKRPLTQSDINLLMGVASQTAVSMANANSFQKLRESERKYRDLVESANSIIMRIDIEGQFVLFQRICPTIF